MPSAFSVSSDTGLFCLEYRSLLPRIQVSFASNTGLFCLEYRSLLPQYRSLLPRIQVSLPLLVNLAEDQDHARGSVHLDGMGTTISTHVPGEEDTVPVIALVTAELGPVRVEHNLVLARVAAAHTIALVRVCGVEVEDEQKLALLGDDHLVALVLERDVLVRALMHEGERLLQPVHGGVKVVEVDVAQVSHVC